MDTKGYMVWVVMDEEFIFVWGFLWILFVGFIFKEKAFLGFSSKLTLERVFLLNNFILHHLMICKHFFFLSINYINFLDDDFYDSFFHYLLEQRLKRNLLFDILREGMFNILFICKLFLLIIQRDVNSKLPLFCNRFFLSSK